MFVELDCTILEKDIVSIPFLFSSFSFPIVPYPCGPWNPDREFFRLKVIVQKSFCLYYLIDLPVFCPVSSYNDLINAFINGFVILMIDLLIFRSSKSTKIEYKNLMVLLTPGESSFLYVVRNNISFSKKLETVRDGPRSYSQKTLTRTPQSEPCLQPHIMYVAPYDIDIGFLY